MLFKSRLFRYSKSLINNSTLNERLVPLSNRTTHFDQASPLLKALSQTPIHWQSFSHDLWSYAEQQNKPIFLFLGYFQCPWTQEMLKSLFENPEIIERLNKNFINVAVDRELRPDLDVWLQRSATLLDSGSGGWPLCAFIHPKFKQPFFCGHYFDELGTQERPAFSNLLDSIDYIFREKQEEIEGSSKTLLSRINPALSVDLKDTLAKEQISLEALTDKFTQAFLDNVDQQWGGLKSIPKFPHTTMLLCLLDIIVLKRPDNSQTLYPLLMLTSQSIKNIGLNDHVEGGFFRYCLDEYWGVPHFEKTLYDNTLLIDYFDRLSAFNKEGSFSYEAQRALTFILEKLAIKDGLYATLECENFPSLEIRDSQPSSYTFDKQQVCETITNDLWPLTQTAFGFEQAPNHRGRWHLHQWYSVSSLAEKLGLELKQVQWQIEPIRQELRSIRDEQLNASIGDFATIAFNAQLAKVLFKTASQSQNEESINIAQKILSNIQQRWHRNTGLTYSQPAASAVLDDYVSVMECLLVAIQQDWNTQYFSWLVEIQDFVLHHFIKENKFLVSLESDHLEVYDDYKDSGFANSSARLVLVLYRLAQLTNNQDLKNRAKQLQQSTLVLFETNPLVYATALQCALQAKNMPLIVISGSPLEMSQWKSLTQDLTLKFEVFCVPSNDSSILTERLSDGKICAILCAEDDRKKTTNQEEFKHWLND